MNSYGGIITENMTTFQEAIFKAFIVYMIMNRMDKAFNKIMKSEKKSLKKAALRRTLSMPTKINCKTFSTQDSFSSLPAS